MFGKKKKHQFSPTPFLLPWRFSTFSGARFFFGILLGLGQNDPTSSNIAKYTLVVRRFDGIQTLYKTIQLPSESFNIIQQGSL